MFVLQRKMFDRIDSCCLLFICQAKANYNFDKNKSADENVTGTFCFLTLFLMLLQAKKGKRMPQKIERQFFSNFFDILNQFRPKNQCLKVEICHTGVGVGGQKSAKNVSRIFLFAPRKQKRLIPTIILHSKFIDNYFFICILLTSVINTN